MRTHGYAGARAQRLGVNDDGRVRHEVEHAERVVVGVGDEQPVAVAGELHRGRLVADADVSRLVPLLRVGRGDVDDGHGATRAVAATGFVAPVGDVETLAHRVEGEADGV